MRVLSLVAGLCVAASLPAQSAYYVPDNQATVGVCSPYPLGYRYMRYQTLVAPADLGSVPGLIADLGFAPCGAALRNLIKITVKMDHLASGQLSTTFANNLTANAVTVLSAANMKWAMVANTWTKLGLTAPFAYNGTDHLVIEIEIQAGPSLGTITSGAAHRGTRPALYTRTVGTLTGAIAATALKMEITMRSGTSTYGTGCAGSNGTPVLSFAGQSRLGKSLDVDLTGGAAGAPAFLNGGFTNSSPYPIDLSAVGATSCSLYNDPLTTLTTGTDPAGAARASLAIPVDTSLVGLQVYFQWLCIDPPANAAGLTTSNGGVAIVGA